MIRRLLIANRGEIACRIMRTARRMGIHTIAVYSEADRAALHVRMADEALAIGPAEARESYLKIEHIVAAAKQSGADAVHPGYGFLSENEDFADSCTRAGLIFVGPPASAIRAMGSKSGAKALMAKAAVPLVPGYHGADQSPELLAREAARIGYPVLIKPSGGGGGKGMHVVTRGEDFAAELESARRVAKNAFGDDRVLLEKYLTRPRHIEVQIFADRHGNCVHLFARDCSVQRRHQKVIEEAPAPGLSPGKMKAMGDAAIAAARAVDYVGAGTVEFIAEGDGFAFMEMNTRLQVEHPVTEMITGVDLVEWQLRIAAGEPLPLTQEQITAIGHAVEARLYAEDPARDFLPSTGKLFALDWPRLAPGIRIDSGVEADDAISPYYDPMLAKLITHGADRAEALSKLARALDDTVVLGIATNRDFLARILRHPEFAADAVDTGFLARNLAALVPARQPAEDRMLATAALSVLAEQGTRQAISPADPHSPWAMADGWQINGAAETVLRFKDGEQVLAVGVSYRRDGSYRLKLPGGTAAGRIARLADGGIVAAIDGHALKCKAVVRDGLVHLDGATLMLVDPYAGSGTAVAAGGQLRAPMPGVVVSVAVKPGQKVLRGEKLMAIEAMKMEHAIAAPADGTVTAVRFAPGDKVAEGDEVIAFEPASA